MASPDKTPSTTTVDWAKPMPKVRDYCMRCRATVYGAGVGAFGVVSPSGLAHIGGDYGVTECGIDGTGKDWWWRL